MRDTRINGRWDIRLPDHRADFHEARPWWEAPRLKDMHARLRPGDRLLDVGSEEGDLSTLYALWGCEVAVMDPQRDWITQTRETFRANHLPAGLAFVGFAADHTNLTPAGVHIDDGFAHLNERPDLPRIRIDDWYFKPSHLMIDVEGSELRVLHGAYNTLLHDRPTVWVSVHPAFMLERYGETDSDLIRFMLDLGYCPTFIDGHHEDDWRFDPT